MTILHISTFIAALAVTTQVALSAPVLFSASGLDAASIQTEVDDFRTALGDLNPFTADNFDGGRRQINWDAAPDAISDPNAFPGDFFNGATPGRARGIEFQLPPSPPSSTSASPYQDATGFALSSTEASGEPVRFGFGDTLEVFSPERLFAPTGGTIFDLAFFDPVDQTSPAAVSGLGIVFANVGESSYANMADASIGFFVIGQDMAVDQPDFFLSPDVKPGGLSFVGALFETPNIIGARIRAGTTPIDRLSSGDNAVVMDDFIFGEPTAVAPVPVPASILLLATALIGGGAITRRKPRA